MKRIISIFLVILLSQNLLSCADNSENFEAPGNFYYIQDQDTLDLNESMLRSEVRETKSYGTQLDELLNAYFNGPVTDGCSSPFPPDLFVVYLEQRDDTISLTLSESFGQMEGLDFTVASTCIALTIFDLTPCNLLELRTEGKLSNGKESVSISRDLLYLTDISHEAS